MKFTLMPTSLRARMVALVVICTLPAMVLVTYTAIERYHTATTYAYGVGRLALNGVVGHFDSLVSQSRDLLAVMAQLPDLDAPRATCNRMLILLLKQMPLYSNLTVVGLNGDVRCSAVPLDGPKNVSSRAWFRQMLEVHKFTSAVVSRGYIIPRGLLLYSAPHFDHQGKFISIVNAVVSPAVLNPPSNEGVLKRYGSITIFSSDGTVLVHYPHSDGLIGTNQSQSAFFHAAENPDRSDERALSGLDGAKRLYALRYLNTGVPGHGSFIASGIDQGFIARIAFLPLIRDLFVITGIALFIILCTWWFTSAFVHRYMESLLDTLQRIGAGDWSTRTGITDSGGEFAALAQGVDNMAETLQTRVAAQRTAEHARKLIEQRYTDLVEQAMDGILVRKPSGEILFVNESFCKMSGYGRDELNHINIMDLMDQSDPNPHLTQFNPGETLRSEGRMRCKDGHVMALELSATCLTSCEVQLIARDISERIETQRKLGESEHQYRELVEQAMVGILVRRPSGELLYMNEAFCRMTGYSRKELLHMNISDLVDPTEAAAIQRVQQVTEGGTLRFQSRLRHKNGNIIYEDLSAHRLANGNIQIIINDITTQVMAERHLVDERDFVFHALDTLPGIFYVFNFQGHFLRWNRHMEEITGYSRDEMKRITSADIVPPERRAAHKRLVTGIINGTDLDGDTELYCKDGTRIPYYYVARYLKWRDQHCIVGMGVDIRDRKEAEQRIQTYLEQMQQLSKRLLEIQEDERRHIAYELHDELGQGLTAALLNLKDMADKAQSAELITQITQTSAIIMELTLQVRTLSLDLRPSVLDDLGLSAAVKWYLRERIETRGIKVSLVMDKSLQRLPTLIETTCFRILQSALTNILRHAKAQQVDVSLQQVDNKLVLTIHDDGLGFDVKAAQNKAVTGKSFGLFGMEERARLAGGMIEITSNRKTGTQVRVVLPLV